MQKYYSVPNKTRLSIINQNYTDMLGHKLIVYLKIYDGTGPGAKLVGRAQGQQIYASKWSHSITLEFTNGRYGCVHVIFIFPCVFRLSVVGTLLPPFLHSNPKHPMLALVFQKEKNSLYKIL